MRRAGCSPAGSTPCASWAKAIRTYTSKPGGRYRTRSHQSTSARSNHRAASAFAAGLSCVIAISLLQHNRLKQPHSHAAGGSQWMARAADCSPATGSGAAGRSGSSVFPRRDQSYSVKWRLSALSRRTCRPRDSGPWRRRSLARSRTVGVVQRAKMGGGTARRRREPPGGDDER